MAQQPQPQYEFHYQRVELLKTEELGVGSYGAVCRAMCDDLPCAAKILHPALFQFTAPRTTSVMQKFEQECRLLSAIKHPHIVQYLGTYHDPESKLPVLLMELMDESLTRFLERSHEPLPYHTEVNLCHDIVLALSYLHSNGIIHRDLSSNNVLLIAGSRAKVTDFGMVKLYDVNHSRAHLTPLTLCPGTMAYMSPEALGEPPVYTDKLDSFSLGVLCVQIMTRQFPDPGNRFKIIKINDPRAPSGRVKVDVPEIERRQFHINLIDPAHPLLLVALDCLKDKDRERPSCHELCGRMSTLKTSPKYTESVQQSQVNTKPTQSANKERDMEQLQDLQQQLHIKGDILLQQQKEIQQQQQQILELQNLLAATNDQLETLQQQLTTEDEQLTIKDQQLAGKDHQLQQKEAAIAVHQQEIQHLRQQLEFGEQVTAEFQQNLLDSEKTIQDLQRQIQELQQQLQQRPSQKEMEDSGSIKLKAPRKMVGGEAVVDGSIAYFRCGFLVKEVYSYDSSNEKWSELPKCPNHGFSLAMVHGFLTTIGGQTPNDEFTNSLLSFSDKKWTKWLPPMPTKRWLTAAVCSGNLLVVAGGTGEGYKKLSTVEVMDTETLQWSTASSLPHPLSEASATLCGDQVYMLGGRDQSGKRSKSVFTCSLASLRQSCQSKSLGTRLKTMSLAKGHKVWHQLADTPFVSSMCASLHGHGQLLAVGGEDSVRNATASIHVYNTTTNSWEVIRHMATPRSQCLVAVLPHDELMVVGGDVTNDSFEFVTVV